MSGCAHQEETYVRDFLLIFLVIIAVLVLREGLTWMFKTNHTLNEIRAARREIRGVRLLLERQGFR